MFESIKPRAVTKSRNRINMYDKIRMTFYKDKTETIRLKLLFGKRIADILGVAAKDTLAISINPTNHLMLHLKKGEDDDWRIHNLKKDNVKSGPLYVISIRWDLEVPENVNKGYFFVNYMAWKGGLLVFMPGVTDEDKQIIVQQDKDVV